VSVKTNKRERNNKTCLSNVFFLRNDYFYLIKIYLLRSIIFLNIVQWGFVFPHDQLFVSSATALLLLTIMTQMMYLHFFLLKYYVYRVYTNVRKLFIFTPFRNNMIKNVKMFKNYLFLLRL